MRTTGIFHRVHISTFASKQAAHPMEEDSDSNFQPLLIKQLANKTTIIEHTHKIRQDLFSHQHKATQSSLLLVTASHKVSTEIKSQHLETLIVIWHHHSSFLFVVFLIKALICNEFFENWSFTTNNLRKHCLENNLCSSPISIPCLLTLPGFS